MSEQTETRPDETYPERPMQPVFERAPEPDPKLRSDRPEETSSLKRSEKLWAAEDEAHAAAAEKRESDKKAREEAEKA